MLRKAGYFRAGLRKIEAAREIGPRVDPARNDSPSFRALAALLRELAG